MPAPQNNLAEHLRSLGPSGSGASGGRSLGGGGSNTARPSAVPGGSASSAAAAAAKFRPAHADAVAASSFQRHSSAGSIASTGGATTSKEKAPPPKPAIPAPVVPAKRPAQPASSDPAPHGPSRHAPEPAPPKSTPEYPVRLSGTSTSSRDGPPVPLHSSGQATRKERTPSQERNPAVATDQPSVSELNARLNELKDHRSHVLAQLVAILSGPHGEIDLQLLVVQRTFLEKQIEETELLIKGQSAQDGTTPAEEQPPRQPLGDATVRHVANSDGAGGAYPLSEGSKSVLSSHAESSATGASRMRLQEEAEEEPASHATAILIQDSPPISPASSRQLSPVAATNGNSARAAGKQRAEEHDEGVEVIDFGEDDFGMDDFEDDDFEVGDTSAAAVLRQFPGAGTMGQSDAADMSHAWSKDLYNGLRSTFKLKEFRQNQLEAMNATLSGKDVFCLMPTGGGKSLCYQLPALLNSGKTKGVTVVISPLLSLIHDQVESLMAKDIPALALTGEQTKEVRNFVMAELCQPVPPVKLLYVTPEFITRSGHARDIFGLLHRRKQLARFVIDEAHCVSQWGHDFRPDYKELGKLRRECPGIPIMAMTATANHRVQTDVLSNLGIQGCVLLNQSFNRANLHYEVRAKPKDCLSDIAGFIKARFHDDCGIIYCLSRLSCETVAQKLTDVYDVQARHYHAGMSKKERMLVQRKWQQGEFKVIVATIAFGMGIDKADVRYVVHHTLPGSLEGYYQETGRAGRDGLASTCVLYYAYKDSSSRLRLIENGEGTEAQKEQSRTNLHQVISYCMNKTDCRRAQVLQYFGEIFDPADCHNSCDNCRESSEDKSERRMLDVTDLAQSVVRLVKDIGKSGRGQGVTMLHCVDVFRGISKKAIRDRGHDECSEFGKGANLSRGDVERLFHRLLLERVLGERSEVNAMGFANAYMQLGPEARAFLREGRKLSMQIATESAQAGSSTSSSRRQALPSTRRHAHMALAAAPDPDDLRHFDLDADGGDDDDDEVAEPAVTSKSSRAPRASRTATRAVNSEEVVARPPKRAATTRKSLASLNVVDSEAVVKCLEGLRKVRREIADENGCAEEKLVDDRVLQTLARAMPTSMEEMAAIDGFDADKACIIGPQMLPICCKYAASKGQASGPRADQERFLSQFRYQDAAPGSSRLVSSPSTSVAGKSTTTTRKTGSSSSSTSIRPLGVSRGGSSTAGGPGKRARAF